MIARAGETPKPCARTIPVAEPGKHYYAAAGTGMCLLPEHAGPECTGFAGAFHPAFCYACALFFPAQYPP
jgi:hypothetical protein